MSPIQTLLAQQVEIKKLQNKIKKLQYKKSIVIDTASIDTNHKLRDKHLRDDKFLDVKKFPQATFISKQYKPTSKGRAILSGYFTFYGVIKSIDIDVHKMGEGKDPWGGERVGFEGTTKFKFKDYNIEKKLSLASADS